MNKEEKIAKFLIQEFKNGNIHDSGYIGEHGRYFVEILDCHFIVKQGYIFRNISAYEGMEVENWYMNNYFPLIEQQLPVVIEQLNKNHNSRRAVMTYNTPDDITICTNYTNCLIRGNDLHYFVHMRANDAVEYRTDYKWHKFVADELLLPNLNCNINNTIIHWNADTFHWYIG